MVTPLGKFLRKLRIDRNEILQNMADKLDVSPSFLSAVENGKKKMPSSWNIRLCKIYDFSPSLKKEFTTAIAETENSITVYFNTLSHQKKEAAISFAREFPELSDEQIESIRILFKKGT